MSDDSVVMTTVFRVHSRRDVVSFIWLLDIHTCHITAAHGGLALSLGLPAKVLATWLAWMWMIHVILYQSIWKYKLGYSLKSRRLTNKHIVWVRMVQVKSNDSRKEARPVLIVVYVHVLYYHYHY